MQNRFKAISGSRIPEVESRESVFTTYPLRQRDQVPRLVKKEAGIFRLRSRACIVDVVDVEDKPAIMSVYRDSLTSNMESAQPDGEDHKKSKLPNLVAVVSC